MITKHDLKPGVKFRIFDFTDKTITSICKSRDVFSVDISYKYKKDGIVKHDSLLLDKDDLELITILED